MACYNLGCMDMSYRGLGGSFGERGASMASDFTSPSALHTASCTDGGLMPKEHKRDALPMGEGQLMLLAVPCLSIELTETEPEARLQDEVSSSNQIPYLGRNFETTV